MIKTERLTLRPFREGDAADVFAYLSGPQPHCFECMKVRTLEEAREAVAERVKHSEYCLAIELEGRVIGEIEAHPESSQPDRAENYTEDTFSPCWMLHPDFQGRGYAFEAARAFFDCLFREKGARRIYAFTEDNNLPSQKLCQRLGMRQEGLFREFVTFVNDADGNPIYENTIQWAILKWEWEGMIDLVRPTLAHEKQVMDFRDALLAIDDSFDGCAGLEKVKNYVQWLDFEDRLKAIGFVPTEVFLGIRRGDGKMVGIIDYRRPLTPFLLRYGGNIGYSVLPGERRKGYATQMLSRLLPICRAAGDEKVLLTCDKTNEASRRTIVRNGGVFENEVVDDVGLSECGVIQRFWITL